MDARTQLISEITQGLTGLSAADRRQVEDAVVIALNRYEVQERCTELTESVGGRDYLSMYLATLRIEGKSPGTLEQYHLRIRQMVDFLGRDVTEITLYDLRYYLACYKRVRADPERL